MWEYVVFHGRQNPQRTSVQVSCRINRHYDASFNAGG